MPQGRNAYFALFLGVSGALSACDTSSAPPTALSEPKGGALGAGATGTGSGADTSTANSGTAGTDIPVIGSRDRPWEVSSDRGESYVPNVFYADDSETEQVMPLTAANGRHQVSRLIYPTLGNPNLYERSDTVDTLTMVMRIEPELLAHLLPDTTNAVSGSWLHTMALHERDGNELAFYAIARQGRDANTDRAGALGGTGGGAFRIRPSALYVHPITDDMPEPFKRRLTIRAVFDQDALKGVSSGLYDVRMEVLKNGALAQAPGSNELAYESQYNALRVFDAAPAKGAYSVINVTDTQASLGLSFKSRTTDHLQEFVLAVNGSTEDAVRNAAFIQFNGDLHNGGSPGGLLAAFVSNTYNAEAQAIVGALKNLNYPIFLTIGNHDGYVATGVQASLIKDFEALHLAESLQTVVTQATPKEWAGFNWTNYAAYLSDMQSTPGGRHLDLFSGSFVRRASGQTFASGFLAIPREQRNIVLYDGFNQWQRTYGPLYYSWTFGQNRYVSLNSFELRQHRRSGWGMYTINYGGNVSPVQLEWLGRQLDIGEKRQEDTVLIAHHDPRGGHGGKDFPYYFAQLDYSGLIRVTLNYVGGEIIDPVACDRIPSWAMTQTAQLGCLHDGLQEWMRADDEFDCNDADRLGNGTCNTALFDPSLPPAQRHAPLFSGFDLLDKVSTHPSVRTFLLGHTHYNSLEVAQSGDELVPATVTLDAAQEQQLASAEVANPLRGLAWLTTKSGTGDRSALDPSALQAEGIMSDNGKFAELLSFAGQPFQRTLQGQNRELMFMRLTTNSALTEQVYDNAPVLGYASFLVSPRTDSRQYAIPQINHVNFHINTQGRFDTVLNLDLDRSTRLGARDPANQVHVTFDTGRK